MFASWAALVQGGYFHSVSFSQPCLEEPVLSSICLSKGEGGCLATVPCKPLPSLGFAFQTRAPPKKNKTKREKWLPSRGGGSGSCQVGQAPASAPLLLPLPQPSNLPPRRDTPVWGSRGPGVPPMEESEEGTEQFGKEVTGENIM